MITRPVSASSLAAFRIVLGISLLYQTVHFWIFQAPNFLAPRFHFTYLGFIRPWSDGKVYVHLAVMGLAAVFFTLGLFYRAAAVVLFASFTYFFLMDQAYYNNHYYLLSLLCFLSIFVEAHRSASLDERFRPSDRRGQAPFWNLLLLRGQIFIVYFFGGIAKLNADWLRGEPARSWLPDAPEWAIYFLTYGGLLFDLAVVPALLWRRSRPLAVIGLIAFHVINHRLFHIGVFPFLMIGATILFFDPSWPRSLLRRFFPAAFAKETPLGPAYRRRAWIPAFLIIVFLFFQAAIPLRHWLYPGNVDWTEEGHLFSWRMKLRAKKAHLRIHVTDPVTGATRPVSLRDDLHGRQIWIMVRTPHMICQYIRYLKGRLEAEGIRNPIIRVESTAGLNSRTPQPLIDPAVNMAEADCPLFGHAPWILPGPTD